jgi:transcription initiation factor IIE alpha subunit
MKESARLDNVSAMNEAFSGERLRWLIGKGDLLVQKGELTEAQLHALIGKTVREEYVRHLIIDAVRNGLRTVTDISTATRLDSSLVLTNLFALMRWNKVEIAEQRDEEYLYVLTEDV